MKPIALFFFSLLLVTAAGAQKVINDPNAESRSVSGFHALRISNAFNVIITQGNEEALVVSANHADDVQYIKATVEKGILRIWCDRKDSWWPKSRKLKVYLSVKNLDEIRGSGACDIQVEGTLNVPSLRLHFSGASELEGKLVVSDKLSIDLSGASDLHLSGSAGQLVIDASGASDVKAYDLQAISAAVSASGASDVKISVEKELSVTLSGASSLRYKGTAQVKDIRTSGASSISRRS